MFVTAILQASAEISCCPVLLIFIVNHRCVIYREWLKLKLTLMLKLPKSTQCMREVFNKCLANAGLYNATK